MGKVNVNGEAIDGGDVDVMFGPIKLYGLTDINYGVDKEKRPGKGPGNKRQGRSYGAKDGSGSLKLKLKQFLEINLPLELLGMDVTDIAPTPVIITRNDKNREAVEGLGLDVVQPKMNLARTSVLGDLEFTNYKMPGDVDELDLQVTMDFIYNAG